MSQTTIAFINYLCDWVLITVPISCAALGFMDAIKEEWPRIKEEYWEPFKNAER